MTFLDERISRDSENIFLYSFILNRKFTYYIKENVPELIHVRKFSISKRSYDNYVNCSNRFDDEKQKSFLEDELNGKQGMWLLYYEHNATCGVDNTDRVYRNMPKRFERIYKDFFFDVHFEYWALKE